jgi:acetyl esterase/lipase
MTINLWPNRALETEGDNAGCPSLTPYLLEDVGPHPAIIVMPGGGYMRRAPHEAEPIARWLNALGIASFVLHYRVSPFRYPASLEDAQRALRLVRHQASAWNLDPERIGVLGFSAGGHLAATVGTRYSAGEPAADDPVERQSSRPDLLILCYPVITMGAAGHAGSRAALLGDRESDPDLIALLSNERQVSGDTPPTFLWHTADDGAVPAENSQRFAAALAQQGVPFELHIFERGAHGLGLGQDAPGVQLWPALCAAWLAQRGFITA